MNTRTPYTTVHVVCKLKTKIELQLLYLTVKVITTSTVHSILSAEPVHSGNQENPKYPSNRSNCITLCQVWYMVRTKLVPISKIFKFFISDQRILFD